MAKRRVPEEKKKVRISISVRKELADNLREIENFSELVEKLIDKYFSEKS